MSDRIGLCFGVPRVSIRFYENINKLLTYY